MLITTVLEKEPVRAGLRGCAKHAGERDWVLDLRIKVIGPRKWVSLVSKLV